MNLRPNPPDDMDINLTPLIDVVFLLLIFFMVSTTFKDDARLRINLPEADGQTVSAAEPEMLEIVIDRAGRFYVDDRAVTDRALETLKRAMTDALGEHKTLPVLVKADAETPHQAVMRVLDAAGQLNLIQVSFAASRPEGQP